MEHKKTKSILYLLLCITYYIVPFLADNTGGWIFILLFLAPIITVIISALYGILCGFKWYYPIIVAALFVPSIFINYNSSAWIYSVVYAILSFLGESVAFLATIFKKK